MDPADLDAYGADLAVRARPRGHSGLAGAATADFAGPRQPTSSTNIPRSARSTTRSGCSASTPRRGSPQSTCCCSSPSSVASFPGSACTRGRCEPGRPKTPRNLARLPAYAKAEIDRSATKSVWAEPPTLRQRHYRVESTGDSVAAERGYLREAGNLVFHISLVFVLVGVAIGALLGFRGTSVVIVGQGFSNNLTQFDDFSAGRPVH